MALPMPVFGPVDTSKALEIKTSDIGNVKRIDDKLVYVDILRATMPRNAKVVMLVDAEGEYTLALHMQPTRYGVVDIELAHIPLPRFVIATDEFERADVDDLRVVFEEVREVAEKVIVFDDPFYYDLLVAWEAYTWLRGLFPKNVNLYVTGFPGTGKSMVLNHIKHFARYPVAYEPNADKSYKWTVSMTLATVLIDEGEYVSRSALARLRKYHETGVYETRFMGVPLEGLTLIELRVDAPVALAATHVPKDVAFLQRGIIIRMKKRHPKIKGMEFIEGLKELKIRFMKTLMLNWFKVYTTIAEIGQMLTEVNEDERVKDVALPFMVFLKLVGKDYMRALKIAAKSAREAMMVSPENLAFSMLIVKLKERAQYSNTYNAYVIPYSAVRSIINDVAEALRARPRDLDYLVQYVFAGCEIEIHKGEPVFICDRETMDSVVERLGGIEAKKHDKNENMIMRQEVIKTYGTHTSNDTINY